MSEDRKKRTERILVMLDDDELRALDTWRFKYRMPSRSAAVRELLRKGLTDIQSDEAKQGEKSSDFGMLDEHGDS